MGLLVWGEAIRRLSVCGLSSLEIVGLVLTFLVIVYNTPQYFTAIYKLCLAPACGKNVNFSKMGQWALITGASEGIGRAFAEELAKRGLNIVIISRTRNKLEAVARDIETRFKTQVKIIAIDFTDGVSVYDTIQDEIQGLEIGTLVNNVGMLNEAPEYFHKSETQGGRRFPDDLLLCNIFPVTKLTHMILPQMVSRKKGVIINVGSLLGIVPTPCMTVYSATKAYIDFFSRSLTAEYEKQGIIIQSLLPGFVYTNMIRAKNSSFAAPNPGTYVRSALKTVGLENRTSAYWIHRLAKRGTELLSFFIPEFIIRLTFSLFDAMRDTWE